jgi:hypothetical protein
MDLKDFRYISEIGEVSLPCLVLAVDGERYRDYAFSDTRKWLYIVHQTAGHMCNQHYMVGTVLRPCTVEVMTHMNTISGYWLDSQCGFLLSLDEVLKYREQLQMYLEVDCNRSFMDLEEGIYPIDCEPEYIQKLTDEKLPGDLDDLIVWESDMDRFCGFIGRWHLYVLGPSSD